MAPDYKDRRIRILFITTGLNTGGAEKMLLRLLKHMDTNRFQPCVVSLLDKGTVGPEIEALGVPVVALSIKHNFFRALWSLIRHIKMGRFDIIQGWMYHGNLLALVASRFARSWAPVCFGIRQTVYDLALERPGTKWVIRANALLSRFTASCIFNSKVSLEKHRALGFSSKRMLVLPNGFELDSFKPDADSADKLRCHFGLQDALVVGMVARFDPAKDHLNFLRAASLVIKRLPNVRFVLVGRSMDGNNKALNHWLTECGLNDVVLLLGERTDIPELNSMFDVACLSSHMEAFPNVIGEAMACETPCVATNVGDVADIVGETGYVVPVRDPVALSKALLAVLESSEGYRRKLGVRARQLMVDRYEIDIVVGQYEAHYQTLLAVV